MNTWAPIFSQLPESTLWEEPLAVRVLFMTMLSIKDPDHVVRMPFRRLCKKANLAKDPEENARLVQEALDVLLRPDGRSIEHQEFQGRRVEVVEGEGWLVLNGEKYRQEMSQVMSRLRKTEWQRQDRARKKGGETQHEALREKAAAEGDVQAVQRLDEIQDAVAPGSYQGQQDQVNPALGQGKSAQNRREALGLGGPEE